MSVGHLPCDGCRAKAQLRRPAAASADVPVHDVRVQLASEEVAKGTNRTLQLVRAPLAEQIALDPPQVRLPKGSDVPLRAVCKRAAPQLTLHTQQLAHLSWRRASSMIHDATFGVQSLRTVQRDTGESFKTLRMQESAWVLLKRFQPVLRTFNNCWLAASHT